MADILEIAVGILVACLSGWLVKPLFDRAHLTLTRPESVNEAIWTALQPAGIERAGPWLGALERLVALASAWAGEYELLAGWLAFKVAAKWESWSNVLRIPDSLDQVPQLEFLRARRTWGSLMLMRFLVGTLSNALLGIVAAFIGKNTFEAISAIRQWLC